MVRSQHGLLPVPAPATALLLARARAPIAPPRADMETVEAELLTPTGAAILTTLAEFRQPALVPEAIGYGYGTKELPWPNALRVTIGEVPDRETADGAESDEVLIETNIDDMNPQFHPDLIERLLAAGALDAWLTPVQMKKGRPGIVVSAIATGSSRRAVEAAFFAHSTTLGIRTTTIGRRRAGREHLTIETRWGPVRLKRRLAEGAPAQAMPEFDDVREIARREGVPLRVVWDEAWRLGQDLG
jgi:uncharacterized protein (DUF111 family)